MKQLIAVFILALSACSGEPTEPVIDGPVPGVSDTGEVDAAGDGGVSDDQDAGPTDSGQSDGGQRDGGQRDSGQTDGGDSGSGADMPVFDPCTAPFSPVPTPAASPPYSGTAFVTNDLITPQDPSSFVDLTYAGTGTRTMFDRRVAQFITVEPHLFDAEFGTTVTVEIQVNPEFSRQDAETEARTYAESVGRLPAFLFRDLETMWIHAGVELFGGGNRNILIHTGQGENYGASLEEIFVHEAVHTSIDAYHRDEARWLEAVAADGVAISTYARDFPQREDLAESVGPYLAYRLRPDRLSATDIQKIEETMPNRIQYFDCQAWTMDLVP
jgi:hypothetical protein